MFHFTAVDYRKENSTLIGDESEIRADGLVGFLDEKLQEDGALMEEQSNENKTFTALVSLFAVLCVVIILAAVLVRIARRLRRINSKQTRCADISTVDGGLTVDERTSSVRNVAPDFQLVHAPTDNGDDQQLRYSSRGDSSDSAFDDSDDASSSDSPKVFTISSG